MELDEYCIKILMILIDKKQIRFNELHRTMNKMKIEISKPTLSDHLKHLVAGGYVTRKVEGLQQVTYILNYEKVTKTKGYWKRLKRIAEDFRENKQEFLSLPEEEQVKTVLGVLAVRKLQEIKMRVALELDPKNFEKQFAVMFWTSQALSFQEFWMIEKCVEDEAYRKRVFKMIDTYLPDSEKDLTLEMEKNGSS
jgi:DNA-binding HxlR family transcriptional regulator